MYAKQIIGIIVRIQRLDDIIGRSPYCLLGSKFLTIEDFYYKLERQKINK